MEVFFEQYFDFQFMGEHFMQVLGGFWVTLQLSFWGGVFALIWGLVLALIRNIPGRAAMPVRAVTIAYIDVFRGIPLLIIILMISGSFPFLTFLPEWIRSPELLGQPSIFWYGIMALTITYGAYFAEIYRAGIEAVPHGQMEASRSLGMSRGQATRTVILPQAVRKVVPPFLNDYIALMKDTSLISILAVVGGRPRGSRAPERVLQRVRAHSWRDHVPVLHAAARPARGLADREAEPEVATCPLTSPTHGSPSPPAP